jgi:hypothetical protein
MNKLGINLSSLAAWSNERCMRSMTYGEFKDMILLEKEIAKTYETFFDGFGKWSEVAESEVIRHLGFKIEGDALYKFLVQCGMNRNNQVSLAEFQKYVREAVRTVLLFSGLEEGKLTKEQATALLSFDWKFAIHKSSMAMVPEERRAASETSLENTEELEFNSTSSESAIQETPEAETTKESWKDLGAQRRWLQRACATHKLKVAAEIRRLGRELVKCRLIATPDLSWPQEEKDKSINHVSNRHMLPDQPNDNAFSSLVTSSHEDLQDFIIHPDLEDQGDGSIPNRFLNHFICCFGKTPAAWKTARRRKELEGIAVRRVGFVFAAYKVQFWFWEMVEMVRK